MVGVRGGRREAVVPRVCRVSESEYADVERSLTLVSRDDDAAVRLVEEVMVLLV